MKTLLLLFLILPSAAFSQMYVEEKPEPTRFDTVPVYMLICIDPKQNFGFASNYTVRGFAVFKTYWVPETRGFDRAPGYNTTQFEKYLNKNAATIPENWLVWSHKPVKP